MNNIISKWLRECRHIKGKLVKEKIAHVTVYKLDCPDCDEAIYAGSYAEAAMNILRPDYENNPVAWTPGLFIRIEEAGLWSKFMHHFCIPLTGFNWDECHTHDYFFAITSDLMRATPPQKAVALSQAIKEVK